MTQSLIRTPYEPILGLNAQGLTGRLYIGLETLSPKDDPKAVFWDSAGLQPAEQPIPVQGGYPMRDGTPAHLYTDGRYSILAETMAAVQVWLSESEGPDGSSPGDGAFEVSFYDVGPAANNDVIFAYTFVRAVQFPNDFAGSYGGCESLDAETVVVLKKNGASVGSITYTVGLGATPVTTGGALAFAVGDILRVVAPADANTLTGERFTFKGAIIA
jgi:hypothetical protein